jgi:hypothetical protein
VETDLRLNLACTPVQRGHPTLRVAIRTPFTPRAGDSRRSVSRLPRSRAFDGAFGRLRLIRAPRLEFQPVPHLQPYDLRLHHLNPTNSRMIKTTSTMLAVINIATVVPLGEFRRWQAFVRCGRRCSPRLTGPQGTCWKALELARQESFVRDDNAPLCRLCIGVPSWHRAHLWRAGRGGLPHLQFLEPLLRPR